MASKALKIIAVLKERVPDQGILTVRLGMVLEGLLSMTFMDLDFERNSSLKIISALPCLES